MFKPIARPAIASHRPDAGFADTQLLHTAGDDDYSGFAPTEMFDETEPAPAAAATDARLAAATSRTALEGAATTPDAGPTPTPAPARARADDEEPSMPPSWITSQWVAAQEAKAHEAANQARALIAAQRRAGTGVEPARDTAAGAPSTRLGRLRVAFERLLPGDFRSLLPLFIGVSVTTAVVSAALPLFDKS